MSATNRSNLKRQESDHYPTPKPAFDPLLPYIKKLGVEVWEPRPIGPACEFGIDPQCGRVATLCYPTWGGGFMSLCDEHGQKHLPYAERISRLVKEGFELRK